MAQTLDFERRMLRNCFDKGWQTAAAIWPQLARVLPRAGSNCSPRPASGSIRPANVWALALGRNLQIHRTQLARTAALLRTASIADRIASCAGERLAKLETRRSALRASARLTEDRGRLDALARVLEGISYRAVLERGFALVEARTAALRRRAGADQSRANSLHSDLCRRRNAARWRKACAKAARQKDRRRSGQSVLSWMLMRTAS